MALEIINSKIVGTIENLEEKLEGKIPIDRLELIYLVNSWGRKFKFDIKASNNQTLIIDKCEPKECYNLSKLDTSKITNMSDVFIYNLFDGDISQWNTSNVTKMDYMFYEAKKFNQDISNWNVSNVTDMACMFYQAFSFNSDISKWDVSNVTNMKEIFAYTLIFNQNISSWNLNSKANCYNMFYKVEEFIKKYNNNKELPSLSDNIKDWLNDNRDRMNEIDIKDKYGKEVDNFFNKIQTNSIQEKEI